MLGRYFLYVNFVLVSRSFDKYVIVIYYNILHYFSVFAMYKEILNPSIYRENCLGQHAFKCIFDDNILKSLRKLNKKCCTYLENKFLLF